ncbi:MAG: AAA family ATPase [Pseudoclavibacter sp.]|nr:AAA family ATPase [Pseudoclavibacter sp.]
MRITSVEASNWRNFTTLEFDLRTRLFIVGPNAAGKSNLLDLFRFLGDVAAPGGGLAAAIERRGGLGRVRSLFARNHRGGRLVVDVRLQDEEHAWRYLLAIKGEGRGRNRPLVDEEIVERDGERILQRPDREDERDPERLTQTHLEQITANQPFRAVAEHFARTRCFPVVPQIVRGAGSAGAAFAPFGGDLAPRIDEAPVGTRRVRLRRVEAALRSAVPGFESLAGRTELSGGTRRLAGLLWALVSFPENGGVLLLEEPELSLAPSIVRTLPAVLATAQRDRGRQVLLSTHALELLDDEGVHAEEILVLRVAGDGTASELLSGIEEAVPQLEAELPASEIVRGLVSPEDPAGLLAIGARR